MDNFLNILKNNRTIILYVLLALTCINLYDAWKRDTAPLLPVKSPAPTAETSEISALPAIDHKTELPSVPKTVQASTSIVTTNQEIPFINVKTDLLDLKISLQGGNIIAASLEDYPISIEHLETKFQLLNNMPELHFIIQSGIVAKNQQNAPSHLSLFSASQTQYTLKEGADSLVVELVWNQNEIEVVKRFTFKRKSYEIALTQKVSNQSTENWTGWPYQQLERKPPIKSGSMLDGSAYTYTGGAYYKPDTKYQKISFDEIKDEAIDIKTNQGWVSFIQHYFLAAIVPNAETETTLFSKGLSDKRYIMGIRLPMLEVASGQTSQVESTLYIGPKLQNHLKSVAEGLELTVDYGWLTVISQPLFWLLSKIHSYIGNWGWAIIILTLLIKLAFYKLSETSYRSMANMRKMTPRIQALKERYGDDRQRMNQAMMEMYKTEKINPLGGCLPMLVQIPVFIALYWMLMETVELRQAPFIFWIQDLSVKDPFFILPLLMGASMFFQQKLNPPPPDPMQAKMMSMLPIVFTGLFAFFPAGLVLYWFINNLASILQQWYITRKIENADKVKK